MISVALRESGIPALPEMEKPAAACVDLLTSRADIAPARIGIQGISMGGFYAPRTAAFEHRLACCVAWGAYFSSQEVAEYRAKLAADYKGSVPDGRGPYVLGHGQANARRGWGNLAPVRSRRGCPLKSSVPLPLHVPLFSSYTTLAIAKYPVSTGARRMRRQPRA